MMIASAQPSDPLGPHYPSRKRLRAAAARTATVLFGEVATLPGLRRQVLARFVCCGLLLAALAATGFYCLGLMQLDRGLEEMALSQGRHLAQMLASQMVAGPGHRRMRWLGGFAFVRFEWRDGRTVELWSDDISAAARAKPLEQLARPPGEGHWRKSVEVGGSPYLLVSAPLRDSDLAVARIVGLYRVDPDLRAQMDGQLAWSVFAVVLAVMAATGALLPVIYRLERRVIRHARDAIEANIGTLEALGGAVAKRDSETDAHNHRVTVYAVRLAERLALADEPIRHLIRGAFLHDVGKIGTPDRILHKAGKLTDAEFAVMKRHVADGLDIIGASPALRPAAEVVGCHHEKYDGSGYPRGLRGDAIPLAARIFAVVDVFDALVSERPYKAPMSIDEAQDILRNGRGSHFEPALVEAFLPISRALRDQIGGNRDEGSRVLDNIIRRYFVCDFSLF